MLEHNPEIGRNLVFGRQDYRILISMREGGSWALP
jgi:hypothetical protein